MTEQAAGQDQTIQPVNPPANPLKDTSDERIKELGAQLKASIDVMKEAKETDGARWAEADKRAKELGTQIQELQEAKAKEDRVKATEAAVARHDEILANVAQGKAKAVGGNFPIGVKSEAYEAGQFLTAVTQMRSMDAAAQAEGKATLERLGSKYTDVQGKATLGNTDAAGGYIMPNPVTAELTRYGEDIPNVATLTTQIRGVNSAGVDLPYQSAAVTKAVPAPWGDTKENVDITYAGVTVVMYTYARIYDLGKQFARSSAGAAEQDVMQSLATAFALAENDAVIAGDGTGDPVGVHTALVADGSHTVAHTAAATLAGSTVAAIAAAAGALANGNRHTGITAVMSGASYWRMLAEGTDEAGFFYAPAAGPTAIPGVAAGTLVSPFGIPVVPANAIPDVGNAAPMIVGQWKALKTFYGSTYRVDSSEVAGSRWDQNLIGYRGEMEFGCDLNPAV